MLLQLELAYVQYSSCRVAMDLLIGLDGVLSYKLQTPSRPPAGCDNGSAIR